LVSKLRSDGNLFDPRLFFQGQFPLNFIEIEVVIEVNFLFDFLFHVNQTDLFVSLSASLNSHHNILASVFSQIMEYRVFGEVNKLIVDLVSIV